MTMTITNIDRAAPVQPPSAGLPVPPTSDGTSALLPEPATFGGDSLVALAIIMTRTDQQQQTESKSVEDAADEAAAKEDAAQVQALENKASQDLGEAWSTGLAGMAGGVLGIVGAGCTDTAGTLDAHDVLEGLSKAAPAAGTGVGGVFKSGADQDDALAAQHQAASQAEIRRYDNAQTDAQAAADSIQKVQQYLQAALQSEAAARNAAARG